MIGFISFITFFFQLFQYVYFQYLISNFKEKYYFKIPIFIFKVVIIYIIIIRK